MSDSALPRGAVAGSPLRASLIEFAVVVVLGACAGAAFEAVRPARRQERTSPGESSAAAPPAQPSSIVDLPPIVTNLGAPQDTWVRSKVRSFSTPGPCCIPTP